MGAPAPEEPGLAAALDVEALEPAGEEPAGEESPGEEPAGEEPPVRKRTRTSV